MSYTRTHAQTIEAALDYLLAVARYDTMLTNLHALGIGEEHLRAALAAHQAFASEVEAPTAPVGPAATAAEHVAEVKAAPATT